jgi:predicted nucleic acid-binding protein
MIEVAHVLSKAHRTRQISAQRAEADLAAIYADVPQLSSSVPHLPRAFEISLQERIGIYDCIYLALAEQEQCGLITADVRLITNLQPRFPQIIALASL